MAVKIDDPTGANWNVATTIKHERAGLEFRLIFSTFSFYGLVFAKKLKQYRDVFRKPAWNNL